MNPKEETLNKFIEENNLSMSYKFVPFSISRNSEEKDKTLNWKVTLKSKNGSYTFDYQKGIGHLPYKQYNLNKYEQHDVNKAIDNAVETGVADNIKGFGKKVFPNPTIKEVLDCLVLDSNVRNYIGFESWAKEFGYEEDSRKAEKIYKNCQKATESFAKVLGGVNKIEELETILYEIENQPTPKKIKP